MVNYYEVLEISEDASPEEIKKSFRRLASKHHPDKGGDTAKFQEIQAAYDTLSDPQKKNQYDHQRKFGGQFGGHSPFGPGQGAPGGFTFNFGDIGDMFGFSFGQGFANHQRVQRNRDLTIQVKVTFAQSYTGTQLDAKYRLPSGKDENVIIDIPAGVHHGQTIRYTGLGDDSIQGIPRGNLNINVFVEPSNEFERNGNDIYKKVYISALDAMIGCVASVSRIDGGVDQVRIRPGVQDGTEFVSQNRGFKDLRSGRTGNLILQIKVNIPSVTDETLINQLKEIYAKISTAPE